MITEAQARHYIAAGETFTVEFKGEEREALGDMALVSHVVCLANGRGGLLFVGVEDDGRTTGARPRHGEYTDPRRLDAYIANNTVPSVPATSQVLTVEGVSVVVVEVPALAQPVSTKKAVFTRRALGSDGKPACVPYHFHEMQSAEATRGAQDYSAMGLADARWEDLNPLEFERLRQTIRRNPGRADRSLLELPDAELARVLGLAAGGEGTERTDRVTVAGVLLVGHEASIRRLVPTHEAAFQVLQGTRVAVNDFVRLPLIQVAEDFAKRFDARNEEVEIAIGPVSVGIPDYSRDGFREALHNALIHRDYSQLGAVHVQWRREEVEVSNPGGFVEGVRLDNLLVAPPKPRNPVLADAFKRIGLVERSGRGIDTIYEGQLRYGRPAPDYTRSTGEAVQVILRGGPANLALARWFIEQETPEESVSVEDMVLVNGLHEERWIGVARAARLLHRDDVQAKALLERLVERGLFEAREDRRRGRTYQLSAATYRALGDALAYTRRIEFEPIQQEHMVLKHVAAHGRITRAEAADLCQIGLDDARAFLKDMTDRGLLVLHSNRRWSYYAAPADLP